MRIILYSAVWVGLLFPYTSIAQPESGSTDFPELIMTKIPGAPQLGKPILIAADSTAVPLISQGLGTAAPAYWDWDGDGIKDLLIGEFGSGSELGRYMGNFIRVYLNIGTETQPAFNGQFSYAYPPFEILSNGTPYSVYQFCCIGFTPQFIDLNNDSYPDMVSGQYFGEVSWFRGSDKGFLNGEPLLQEGNPREPDQKSFMKNQAYWLYSSASFGDFTGDGKHDMIVGGRTLRISRNIGTSSSPQFKHRELLSDTKGGALKIYEYTPEERASMIESELYTAGDYKLSPVVVDWDNDGVLDLLVTNGFNHKGKAAIDFFRGVKSGDDHRFEPGVPLFTTKDNGKVLPGISPFVFVTDWNHDGVNDLLIGTSVVTLHNKFNGTFSWNWEKDMGLHGIGKDPGLLRDINQAASVTWLLEEVKLPAAISLNDFMTMRHQGYVYVMLGSKEKKSTNKKQKKTKK